MAKLPAHGKINCSKCFGNKEVEFDKTTLTENDWRIRCNPLACGGREPEVIVLGFSKGPTQAGSLSKIPHNEIAFRKSRVKVGKILAHIGLIAPGENEDLKNRVDQLIADPKGRFHFGSLIRCTVEKYDQKSGQWKGSGGGMLGSFVSCSFGQMIASNCIKQFLKNLPQKTKLIVLFGLGSRMNYVSEAYKLFQKVRPGDWKQINSVSYTDGHVTVVHVEHFASQGALIPNWLGENKHERAKFGALARDAVKSVL